MPAPFVLTLVRGLEKPMMNASANIVRLVKYKHLPHTFLRCERTQSAHQTGRRRLYDADHLAHWDALTEAQQVSLLLLQTVPSSYGLPDTLLCFGPSKPK